MSNFVISYGNQQYQVSPQFRSAVINAAYNPEDDTITAAEHAGLARIASTPDEQAFLSNHVRVNPELQQAAEFDPTQLSFSGALRQSPEAQEIEASLENYDAERPLPPQERTPDNPTEAIDTIPEFAERIQQLPPEERPRLERILDEKVNQSVRYYVQHLDQSLTAVAQSPERSPSGDFPQEQLDYIDQRYAELEAYQPYYGSLNPDTMGMMGRLEERLEDVLGNGNREAPAATESSSGPPEGSALAQAQELRVGAGFSYMVERGGPLEGGPQSSFTESTVAVGGQYTWTTSDYSIAATGGVRFSDREQEGPPLMGSDPTRQTGSDIELEARIRYSERDRSYSAYASTNGFGAEAEFRIPQRDGNEFDDPRIAISIDQSEERGVSLGLRLTQPIG